MSTKLSLPKSFDPHLNPSQILLIGCGGTGSHSARLLARLLSHLQSLGMRIPTLRLIDPDIVEAKNVGRQLFSPAEIGLSKAEALARRLSLAFGLAIEWQSKAFNAKQHLSQNSYSTILLDAVDNHPARREIANAAEHYSTILISAGNHVDSGQVSIGNQGRTDNFEAYLEQVANRQDRYGNKDSLQQLPNAYLLFPQLLEPEAAPSVTPEESCADLLLRGEQDLLINDTMALVLVRYVQQILLRQEIHSFLTYVDLGASMSIKPIPITLDNLRQYLQGFNNN